MGNKCFRPGEGAGDFRPSQAGKVKNQMQGPGAVTTGPKIEKDNGLEIENEDQNDAGVSENLLQPGKKISMDDFQLIEVIGRGSFGKVFLTRRKDTGKPFAMKILKKDQLLEKNLLIKTQGKYFISNLLAERDILEKVKNPYICSLHYAF